MFIAEHTLMSFKSYNNKDKVRIVEKSNCVISRKLDTFFTTYIDSVY